MDEATVNFYRTVEGVSDVEVDADGEADFIVRTYGDDANLTLTIEEMEAVLRTAKAHHAAYEAYRLDGDLNADVYNAEYHRHFA